MKTLNYSIEINAPKDKVWEVMLAPETYRQWACAFSAESQYAGEWREGSHMVFFDPTMGGTKALLEKVVPGERIHARHVAILDKEDNEDTDSEMARKWIGSTETYAFTERDGVTELSIAVRTQEEFAGMFNDGWSRALGLLKGLCEA